MSDDAKAQTLSKVDFETIEAAVLETARGRWFLAEHARRARALETQKILAAIADLALTLASDRLAPGRKQRAALVDLSRDLGRAKAEIAALVPGSSGPSDPLAGILRSLDKASADILDAAGDVHEAAWQLRDQGANPVLCDALERYATEIYAACGAHGAGVRGAAKLVQAMRAVEDGIAALTGEPTQTVVAGLAAGENPEPTTGRDSTPSWVPGSASLPRNDEEIAPQIAAESAAPSLPAVALRPAALALVASPERAPETVTPRHVLDRMKILAELDALTTREKLNRFT